MSQIKGSNPVQVSRSPQTGTEPTLLLIQYGLVYKSTYGFNFDFDQIDLSPNSIWFKLDWPIYLLCYMSKSPHIAWIIDKGHQKVRQDRYPAASIERCGGFRFNFPFNESLSDKRFSIIHVINSNSETLNFELFRDYDGLNRSIGQSLLLLCHPKRITIGYGDNLALVQTKGSYLWKLWQILNDSTRQWKMKNKNNSRPSSCICPRK